MTDRDRLKETELDVPGEEPRPTSEVGSEGGSPGDVEVGTIESPATGSEATETEHPSPRDTVEIRRDETGIGRRPA
jgi:hypothetical protein